MKKKDIKWHKEIDNLVNAAEAALGLYGAYWNAGPEFLDKHFADNSTGDAARAAFLQKFRIADKAISGAMHLVRFALVFCLLVALAAPTWARGSSRASHPGRPSGTRTAFHHISIPRTSFASLRAHSGAVHAPRMSTPRLSTSTRTRRTPTVRMPRITALRQHR